MLPMSEPRNEPMPPMMTMTKASITTLVPMPRNAVTSGAASTPPSAAVAPPVEAAQEDTLEQHSQRANDDRRDDQRQQEASGDGNGGIADIGAEPENDAVGKIDDAHDAEDQRQPAGDEEQDRRLRE